MTVIASLHADPSVTGRAAVPLLIPYLEIEVEDHQLRPLEQTLLTIHLRVPLRLEWPPTWSGSLAPTLVAVNFLTPDGDYTAIPGGAFVHPASGTTSYQDGFETRIDLPGRTYGLLGRDEAWEVYFTAGPSLDDAGQLGPGVHTVWMGAYTLAEPYVMNAWSVSVEVDNTDPIRMALSQEEVWPRLPDVGSTASLYRRLGLGAVDDTVDEVEVTLQNAEGAIAGASVTVQAEWVPGSGAHAHGGSGDGSVPLAQLGSLTDLATGLSQNGVVTATTDAAGRARVQYRAPEFGGLVLLRAAAEIDGERVETEAEVTVRVPDLQLLPRSTEYEKVGGTSNHQGPPSFPNDENHWAHPDVLAGLQQIAREWLTLAPSQAPLTINDVSLPWGGRFDIAGRWDGSHSTHRVGRDADIRTTRSLSTRLGVLVGYDDRYGKIMNKEFEELCLEAGASKAEIHGSGSNEHYHVYFYNPSTP